MIYVPVKDNFVILLKQQMLINTKKNELIWIELMIYLDYLQLTFFRYFNEYCEKW